MTIQEMIDVLEAAKAGKQIQRSGPRIIHGYHEWQDAGSSWNFNAYDYRVKPEPREAWITPETLAAFASPYNKFVRGVVHVREVLE